MAVASFGPSQRLEISRYYLNQNETCDRTNRYRIYDPIHPKNNVAEEGQVVLLDDVDGETMVIPDAAGYQVGIDQTNLEKEDRDLILYHELKKYRVGVNQLQKGVNAVHSISGLGWDISCTSGHDVLIKHTGHEPIHRFDYIAVRFPKEEDIQAQADIWNARTSQGSNVSKFATYPVRENVAQVLGDKFHQELKWVRQKNERGYSDLDSLDSPVEQVQIPALLKIASRVMRGLESNIVKDALEFSKATIEAGKFTTRDSPMLYHDETLKFMKDLADVATEFVSTLRPPIIVAQCIDFKSVEPHEQSFAICGDTMRCIMW